MADRIDKWLWCVRLFKTRSTAAEACKSGRVMVNGMPAKPSREVKAGDEVSVRKMPAVYRFKVLDTPRSRQPAREVPKYMTDITPPEELEKVEIAMMGRGFMQRDRGAGRPTKRERRDIDDLREEFAWSDDELDLDEE